MGRSAVCVASGERLNGVDVRPTLSSKDGRHRIRQWQKERKAVICRVKCAYRAEGAEGGQMFG